MRAYSILDGKLGHPFDDSNLRPRAMFSEVRDGIKLYWHQPIDPEQIEQIWSEIDYYENEADEPEDDSVRDELPDFDAEIDAMRAEFDALLAEMDDDDLPPYRGRL